MTFISVVILFNKHEVSIRWDQMYIIKSNDFNVTSTLFSSWQHIWYVVMVTGKGKSDHVESHLYLFFAYFITSFKIK